MKLLSEYSVIQLRFAIAKINSGMNPDDDFPTDDTMEIRRELARRHERIYGFGEGFLGNSGGVI